MVARISNSDRRKALKSLKQRGIVVQVGALEKLYLSYHTIGEGTFPEFLDRSVDFLGRTLGTKDGILTQELASSIGDRLQRENDRKAGITSASIEVIDAFQVPRWRPEPIATSDLGSAGTQVCKPGAPVIDAKADAKGALFRSRYEMLLSKTMRNPRFKPPNSASVPIGKKSPYFQLTGIESLSGSKGEKCVFAMLTQLEENSWFLEDLNGSVRVDLSEASITAGLHTECSFVIAQGILKEDPDEEPIFLVSAMGTPACEEREDSLIALGRDANIFGGEFDPSEAAELLQIEEEAEDVTFMLVSDVALDNSRVMAGLRHIFRGYLEDKFIPTVIVLMGNFLSHSFGQNLDDITTLQEKFGELGSMIRTDFEPLAQQSTFVIVPSMNDPGPGNVLPRPPMPSMLTKAFVEAIGSDRVHLATNPCRIRYLTQEMVILRDDIMQKMVRHCSLKPDLGDSGSMAEHLIKTIADQAHLCPLPLSARPVLWNHDQALWLFPTPHTIVIADRVDSYICEYSKSLGLNPGSFGTNFSFQMYMPAQRRAQQCSIDSEDVNRRPLNDDSKKAEGESMELSNPPMAGHYEESDEEEHVPPQHYDPQKNELSGADQIMEEPETERNEEDSTRRKTDLNHSEDHGEDQAADQAELKQKPISSDDTNRPHPLNAEDEAAEGVSSDEDEIESDDDSLLVPAEGIKRLDIKALVNSSKLCEESHPQPESGSDED